MSSIVKYNTKHLVPISNVSITHTMGVTASDQCLRPVYTIELNGYLIYNMGSPTSSGTFGDYTAEQCEVISEDNRLNALLAKHCAIGSLFRENYKELELGTTSGSPNLTAYPSVVSISLDDTSNPTYWGYTVSLEADNLYCGGASLAPTGSGCPAIISFDESWDISYDESEFISESGDNRLWKISHTISAVGAGEATSGGLTTLPYVSAKNFVCSKSKSNAVIPSVCIDNFDGSGNKYNYSESHSVDIGNGSYSLIENWVSTINPYIESYTVETQESSDVACPTVSIQGSIRGFDTRVSGSIPATGSRYYVAKTRWDSIGTTGVLALAQGVAGFTLDSNPLTGSIGRNTFAGEITYNYTYRKLPFKWLPSAKFEKVSYGTEWGADSYASIQLLRGGEVMHPLNYDASGRLTGKKLNKYTLSINAVYHCYTGIYYTGVGVCCTGIGRKGPRFTSPYSGEIQAVIDYYNPTGDPTNWFTVVDSQSENYSAQDGSWEYNLTWVSQPSGNCNLMSFGTLS